jgi:hypothetical protein
MFFDMTGLEIIFLHSTVPFDEGLRPITCVRNFRSFAHSILSRIIILIVKNDPKLGSKSGL